MTPIDTIFVTTVLFEGFLLVISVKFSDKERRQNIRKLFKCFLGYLFITTYILYMISLTFNFPSVIFNIPENNASEHYIADESISSSDDISRRLLIKVIEVIEFYENNGRHIQFLHNCHIQIDGINVKYNYTASSLDFDGQKAGYVIDDFKIGTYYIRVLKYGKTIFYGEFTITADDKVYNGSWVKRIELLPGQIDWDMIRTLQ